MGNNPINGVDPDGGFFQELKNWAIGRGWMTNEAWHYKNSLGDFAGEYKPIGLFGGGVIESWNIVDGIYTTEQKYFAPSRDIVNAAWELPQEVAGIGLSLFYRLQGKVAAKYDFEGSVAYEIRGKHWGEGVSLGKRFFIGEQPKLDQVKISAFQSQPSAFSAFK